MTIGADGVAHYPWNHGETLTAAALNAAIAQGLSGGTMTGPLHMATQPFDNASTDGNDTALITPNWTPCYPVANSPYPGIGYPAIRSQFVVQAQTASDYTVPECTGVFGLYVNTGQPNGQKFTLYSGAVQGPQGGTTWSLNTDVVRNGVPSGAPGGPSNVGSSAPGTPGAIPTANGTIGYELDFTNWDQDCAPGGPFAVGMYIHNQSKYCSLASIYWDSSPQLSNNFAWHFGIMITGQYTIEDAAIFDGSNAGNVIRVGGSHYCVVDVVAASPTFTGPMWNGPLTVANTVTANAGGFVVNSAGPTIRAGTGAATGTQPAGSLWLRTDGSAGARLYVSAGGGTWAAVAGV